MADPRRVLRRSDTQGTSPQALHFLSANRSLVFLADLPCSPRLSQGQAVSFANNVIYRVGNTLGKAFNEGKHHDPSFGLSGYSHRCSLSCWVWPAWSLACRAWRGWFSCHCPRLPCTSAILKRRKLFWCSQKLLSFWYKAELNLLRLHSFVHY